MKRRSKVYIHYLECVECGKEFPIPRWKTHAREKDHIKTFYCPYCQKETDHRERQDNYLSK